MNKTVTRRCAGMSVIEMTVASGVIAVIVLVSAGAVIRSFAASSEMNRASNVEKRSQGAIDTIAGALADAGGTTLSACAAPTGASSLDSRTAAGFTGGVTTWDNMQRIEWRASPTDPLNSLDDDKNGVVDDGIAVWVRNTGLSNENTVVLARGIPAIAPGEAPNGADDNGDGLQDERGLSFSRTGNSLRVRLSVVEMARDGTTVVRSAMRTIALRN